MGWSIYYTIEESQAVIVRCVGDESPLTIPERIEGFPVTKLGADCFGAGAGDGREGLFSAKEHEVPPVSREDGTLLRITLPDTIRTLGDRAFARCRKLPRLTLPKQLETLGIRAFENCASLEHMELPEGITKLPEYAFAQCRKLKRITLPSRLTSVGHHAFYNCIVLEGLALPDTVDYVDEGVFLNCRNVSWVVTPLGVNLSVLLSDLPNDLDLTIHYPDGTARFFLPGFSYEYEDIIAPRMWRSITYGSGQLYRECFSSRDVDYELFESYFEEAKKQDDASSIARIAWYRLRWPYALSKGKESYEQYLTAHCDEIMKFLLEREDLEGLDFLLEHLEFDEKQRDTMARLAERAGKVRFVSRLLEAGMGKSGGADKEFDL